MLNKNISLTLNLNKQPKNKNMKKLILVLVAASFGLTSCNKETKLENRLDGKWEIDSYSKTENSVVTFIAGSESVFQKTDTSYTTTNIDPTKTVVTTGNIDFVSDLKLVEVRDEKETTLNTDGSTTVKDYTYEEAKEYYVSGEDEITVVEFGDFTVFQVTSNEKDSQTWESESQETDIDNVDGGLQTTVTTTKEKYTLKLVK